MREIKFRGLMTTGEWVYGLPHLDLPNSTLYFNECSYRICWNTETGGQANAPIKNGTLCQFTGLLDKNGREVFEGDVLEADNYRVEIKFTGGQFVGYNKNYSITETQNRNWFAWEVIGDIFNNPELL